jgi:antitoxin (DNA-binding transcriptional repressor) of toxin-antitoxin stability system
MSTSIRDLRNRFPKVRKLVETLGEVILTEKGKPRYRLTLYTPASAETPPAPMDYWARLNSYQPRSMTKAQARALHDENRGDR